MVPNKLWENDSNISLSHIAKQITLSNEHGNASDEIHTFIKIHYEIQ